MNTFRKFCAALVLSAALILPVFAGETQFPGADTTTTTTSSSQTTTELCASGETQFPGATSNCETSIEDEAALDPATGMMLTLLEGLLSLF
jgi:hypothetical protein